MCANRYVNSSEVENAVHNDFEKINDRLMTFDDPNGETAVEPATRNFFLVDDQLK